MGLLFVVYFLSKYSNQNQKNRLTCSKRKYVLLNFDAIGNQVIVLHGAQKRYHMIVQT